MDPSSQQFVPAASVPLEVLAWPLAQELAMQAPTQPPQAGAWTQPQQPNAQGGGMSQSSYDAVQQFNQMLHDASMDAIDGIYVEPEVEYYDYDGNYLGAEW